VPLGEVGEDTAGALINISVELPKLLDRRARAVAVFTDHGITDLHCQVDVCVQLLEDLKIRADFINKLRMFYEMLGLLEHRPEVPPDVFRTPNSSASSTRWRPTSTATPP
jgi:type I restriction enzyme R subunit